MAESERVYQQRDIILARLDENVKSGNALLSELKQDFKDHADRDRIDFNAVGTEMQNIKDDIQRKYNFIMRIILPAIGGCGVIVFLLENFLKH